jgi:hypothetical protein
LAKYWDKNINDWRHAKLFDIGNKLTKRVWLRIGHQMESEQEAEEPLDPPEINAHHHKLIRGSQTYHVLTHK